MKLWDFLTELDKKESFKEVHAFRQVFLGFHCEISTSVSDCKNVCFTFSVTNMAENKRKGEFQLILLCIFLLYIKFSRSITRIKSRSIKLETRNFISKSEQDQRYLSFFTNYMKMPILGLYCLKTKKQNKIQWQNVAPIGDRTKREGGRVLLLQNYPTTLSLRGRRPYHFPTPLNTWAPRIWSPSPLLLFPLKKKET